MSSAIEVTRAPTVSPSGAALGADIGSIDLNEALAPAQVDAIKAAWADHLVLRFRSQQRLTLERPGGVLEPLRHARQAPDRQRQDEREHDALPPAITVISNVKVGASRWARSATARPYGMRT